MKFLEGIVTRPKFSRSFKHLHMNITFEELQRVKHALPHGSIARIAQELNIEEQTVHNYFGAQQYKDGQVIEFHLETGPNGGIVHLEDTTILNRALQIIGEMRN